MPQKRKSTEEEEDSEVEDMEEEDGEVDESGDEEGNAMAPPSKKHKGNEEADVGIVEKITLENFMNHKHLELTFGPKINFIVGVNGSM